ncbi:transposase [Cucumis melo var. makuwa]|uniref:Transposase n=1 Tax=Cucumis melo var. makuwa TaxID=1194695 RepID=A0A5D3DLB9_CUCMM|nr:transposase [Cucumis melo var. makuwa]
MIEVAHEEYSKDPNGFEKLLIDAEKPLKEFANATECPECGQSRWKNVKDRNEERKQIPSKVIWYFPPIPRFKRLFRSIECAENLTWHASERIEDGKLRHPADSPAWKLVDFKWPDFGSEPRNLRLALSADGVNPHGDMSSKYSCWPIVMVIYNLPPWLCMKRKYMMLSMLISGPKQPGDDIGTYLAPLIEDLKLLWENGVECYDAYREEVFNLRSVLLWTINDFPAYGNLSGCCVKGYKACPICGDNTNSIRLRHGKKIAYLGHRRFLARDHPYRRQKKSFNGKKELGTIPEPLSGEDVYLKLKDLEFPKGKKIHKNLSMNRSEKICWNRLSSFFELPYWKDLHVRHCLDVMHIEKNVCMNILGTLLDIPGKSKDGLNARRDLVDLKLRPELAPISSEKKIFIPPACYTLTKEEKRCVLKTLSRIKVPEGYSSNIRNLVSMTDLKLNSLKSHDCHVLIQQLFPIAIRSVLPKHVRYAITRLCIFFNSVCNKVLDAQQLDKLEEDIVVTLCLFEKYFPPSFFTIMIHLTVHIVREVKLCGPIYLRWMYPFERFMKVIKNSVRNRYRPEGCIAESYLIEEAIEFCSDFLSGVDPVGLGTRKSQDHLDTSNIGRPLSMGVPFKPEQELLRQAHRYVLENTIDVQPYME